MMVLRRHASLMGRRLSTVSAAARPSAAELTAILEQQQREAAAQTVPWFVEQMPEAYFRQVNAEAQRNHLRAITAVFSVQGSQSVPVPELALNDNAGLYTFLSKSSGASGHGRRRDAASSRSRGRPRSPYSRTPNRSRYAAVGVHV